MSHERPIRYHELGSTARELSLHSIMLAGRWMRRNRTRNAIAAQATGVQIVVEGLQQASVPNVGATNSEARKRLEAASGGPDGAATPASEWEGLRIRGVNAFFGDEEGPTPRVEPVIPITERNYGSMGESYDVT